MDDNIILIQIFLIMFTTSVTLQRETKQLTAGLAETASHAAERRNWNLE